MSWDTQIQQEEIEEQLENLNKYKESLKEYKKAVGEQFREQYLIADLACIYRDAFETLCYYLMKVGERNDEELEEMDIPKLPKKYVKNMNGDDIYHLLGDLEENGAKKISDWVYEEVLPAIEKYNKKFEKK